jgi:hypothetical protein
MDIILYFQLHTVCWRQSLRRGGLGFCRIYTDACKGLEVGVDNVFPGVDHRECMRHLAANFGKKFKGCRQFVASIFELQCEEAQLPHEAVIQK